MSLARDCAAFAIIGFRVEYEHLHFETTYKCRECGKFLKKSKKCCKKDKKCSKKRTYCSGKLVVDEEEENYVKDYESALFEEFVGRDGRKWKVYNKKSYEEMRTLYVYICVKFVGGDIEGDGETAINFGDLSLNLKQKQLKEDIEDAQKGLWDLGMFGLFSIFEVPC